MRKGREKDETGLWKRSEEQVVGQLFFPGITTVDTYKLQFTEVMSGRRKCCCTGACWSLDT